MLKEYLPNNKSGFIFFDRLYSWFDNTFLLGVVYSYIPNESGAAIKTRCYKLDGEILYETIQFNPTNYIAINIEEMIEFEQNVFFRKNLKSNTEVWESGQPLKDLPSNIRIDKTTFEVIDKDFTKCTFNYTTYEGDKRVISFKINNNTGEFVQL